VALSDRLEAGPPKVIHGNPCSIGTTLAALPPKERESLQRMLDEQKPNGKHAWTESMIFDALSDEGIEVGKQSIGRHRNRRCRCSS
jgi:hypothetical protein